MLKKYISLFISFTLIIPTIHYSKETKKVEIAKAVKQAEIDAKNDVNMVKWLLTGCLGGPIGYAVACSSEPTPKTSRLLGKSPEYIGAYTKVYKEKVKFLRKENTIPGCVVNTTFTLLCVYALICIGSIMSQL